ncbi:hypothetical protein [Azohydromonas aeria]|uniref:hypothetical protein n=1 Tax=Azohydromonas aeria TaxID=2590212 RepID=UPI0012F77703|nr:hypothetical protein [Azohydromonas aeria]
MSGSLVLAAIGLGSQAQQADLVAMEQLRREMTDAVLRAFGLDQPPSLDLPRPRHEPAPAISTAAAATGVMSKLELQVRRILGFAPAAADDEAARLAAIPAADADAGAAPAATAAAADTPAPQAAAAPPVPATGAEAAPVAAAAPAPAPGTSAVDTAAATTGASAQQPLQQPPQQPPQQPIAVAVSDSLLDTMRGGFIGENGLQISFGIERAVYVNGNLVTTTSLNLSALGALSAGKGAALSPAELGKSIALIQNGAGSTVLSNLGPAAIGTVIQNTLNGQKIQTLTTINATVNSLGVLRSIEAQRNLRSAITDSLRR